MKKIILLSLLIAGYTKAGNLQPSISLSFSDGKHQGIKSVSYTRSGPATFYNMPEDKLINVEPNQPRYEMSPGNPSGNNKGILLETKAKNYLVNSSFENQLNGWRIEGNLKTDIISEAFHGKNALKINGKGRIVQEVSLIKTPPAFQFGCLSGYLYDDEQAIEKVRMYIHAIDGKKCGPNLIKKTKFVKRMDSKWQRFIAIFKTPKQGLSYVFGFNCLGIKNLILDACQLEVTNMPWCASSYIPTLDRPEERGKDYYSVKTDSFPVKEGTVAVWYKCTNPFGRAGNLFVHGPFENINRIYLGTENATAGNVGVRAVKRLMKLKQPESDWHLYTLTWDGSNASLYFDGEENSDREGPFAYKDLKNYSGSFQLGDPNPIYLGPEGIISEVSIYAQAIPENSVRVLSGKKPKVLLDEKQNIPVPYTVNAAGRVSVGIYNNQGLLKRQLVLGEEKKAGNYTAWWDGRDDDGNLLAAGDYEARIVENNMKADWKVSVGNSGKPPWGKTKVRGGLFRSIVASDENFITINPTLEGNRGSQCFSGKTGDVLWTSEFDPVYGDMCAVNCDNDYAYIVGLIRNEKDAHGNQTYREVLWRLDKKTGKVVPWKKDTKTININKSRTGPPGRRFVRRYYKLDNRYNDPFNYLEVNDIEILDNNIYIPFRRENLIRVFNAETGEKIKEITGIPSPKGIAVTKDSIFVVSGNEVLKYDQNGKLLGTIIQGLTAPYEVEISPDGNIFVTDFGDCQQIKIFSNDGQFIKNIGTKYTSKLEGKLDRLFFPTSIAFQKNGSFGVTDFGNGRLLFFDKNGNRKNKVNAHGFGGMDGGVSFIPGKPEMLFTNNVNVRLPWMTHSIVAYKLNLDKGKWEVAFRWPDVTPVFSKEPIYARTLPNGRTYLFLLTRWPTIYELFDDGRLEFCATILHPQDFCGGYGYQGLMKKQIFDDAKKLKLFKKDGVFKSRMVWTDANRNLRIEEDEITYLNDPEYDAKKDKGFYTVNDADVDNEGNLYLGDFFTSTIWKFKMNGFDKSNNPLYDWKNISKINDIREHKDLYTRGWGIYGKEIDKDGNVYLSQQKGNACAPDDLRILKFDKNNKLLWKVGRKSKGLKDKPGEFAAIDHIPHVENGILYILEYEGTLDLYTTDGLYLATFLEAGNHGKPGPTQNWGENFFGDVVTDKKTGKTYFVINTHNYVLPSFEIIGKDTIRRSDEKIVMTKEMHEKFSQQKFKKKVFEDITFIYPANTKISVDGKFDDWNEIPEKVCIIPDQENDYYAKYRLSSDRKNLYIALSVGDPTPAVNNCTGKRVLWDGDAIEIYISKHPRHSGWIKGDYILHIAASEDKNKVKVGLLDRTTGVWSSPKEIKTTTQIWKNKKGYNLEIAVPFDILGFPGFLKGDEILFDFDLCYSNPEGKHGFKLFRSPTATNIILRNANKWGMAKFVEKPGEEKALFLKKWNNDWKNTSPQARLEVEETNDMYKAELNAAYDDKNLYLKFFVKDPDPAICTPGTQWVGTGDFHRIFLDGHQLYIVASPAYPTPYHIQGGKPKMIDGAKSKVKVLKDSYILEVTVPWKAFGGKKKMFKFNWKIGWSDKTGGSAFARRILCEPKKPTKMILTDN